MAVPLAASRVMARALRGSRVALPAITAPGRRYAHTRTQKVPPAQVGAQRRQDDNWLHDAEPLRKSSATRSSLVPFGLPAPRQLVAHLDDHVIGQERAKKYLAVALFNHYVRILSNEENLEQADDIGSRQRERRAGSAREEHRGPIDEGNMDKGELDSQHTLRPARSNPPAHRPAGEALPSTYFSPSHPRFPRNAQADETSRSAARVSKPIRAAADRANTADEDTASSPFRLDNAAFRPHSSNSLPPRHSKSNLLLLGPSGVGKTLLVSTLASTLRVPFISIDATPLTASGYVGEDVDVIGRRLIAEARRICEQEAAETGRMVEEQDVVRTAQRGIVYIDEVDKLATRRAGSGTGGPAASGGGGRDIGGEAVQQALLRILEGCVLQVQGPAPRASAGHKSSSPPPPPSATSGKGKGRSSAMEGGLAGGGVSTSPSEPSSGSSSQPTATTTYNLDTSSVLFVLSGAFVGVEDIIRQRLTRSADGGSSAIASLSSTQLLTHHLSEVDLLAYGLIPEFLGRVPSICPLLPLSEDELVRILVEPRNSLVEQYRCLLALSGVELRATKRGLREVARRAMHGRASGEGRGLGGAAVAGPSTSRASSSKSAEPTSTGTATATGARGLRGILESLLLDVMFLSPGGSIRFALIDGDAASGRGDVKVWSRGGRGAWLNAWAEEQEEDEQTSLRSGESRSTEDANRMARSELYKDSRYSGSSSRPWPISTPSPAPPHRPHHLIRSQRYIDPTSQSLIDAADGGGGSNGSSSSSSSSSKDADGARRPSRPQLTAAQVDVIARRKSRARLNRPSRVGNVRVCLVD